MRPLAISFIQLSTFWFITALLVASVVWVALRSIDKPERGKRRWLSIMGIALQSAGCVAAGIGFTKPSLPWWAPYSIVSTMLVLMLGGTAIALFLSAASTMGKNWSLVARTRSDHELMRTGAFAIVRHPIYLALLLYVLCIAAALGHWQQLVFAIPLYLAGTFVRIREEEKLLRAQFGEEHAQYVRDVPALIPLML
jgi:protein-S-isoprenylcysteine O-methyltransferase Ste14